MYWCNSHNNQLILRSPQFRTFLAYALFKGPLNIQVALHIHILSSRYPLNHENIPWKYLLNQKTRLSLILNSCFLVPWRTRTFLQFFLPELYLNIQLSSPVIDYPAEQSWIVLSDISSNGSHISTCAAFYSAVSILETNFKHTFLIRYRASCVKANKRTHGLFLYERRDFCLIQLS